MTDNSTKQQHISESPFTWDWRTITMVPGVLYSPLESRARIFPTGLEVWEVIREYLAMDSDWNALRETFDWLTEDQLRAALAFYAANREFVEARIARDEAVNLEVLWKKYPHTRPPHLNRVSS